MPTVPCRPLRLLLLEACKPTEKQNTEVAVSGYAAKCKRYYGCLDFMDTIKGPIRSVVKETVEELAAGKQKERLKVVMRAMEKQLSQLNKTNRH
jgi:hypothetical protein